MKQPPLHIYLGLGSNLGAKEENIEAAYKKIEERIGTIFSKSAFYVTEPQGFFSEHLFVNSVCEVVSYMNVNAIFAITKEIEKEIGRAKKSQNGIYADRIIDIDLLIADNAIINTPDLTIPHPKLHLRRFVLEPLAEIAPDLIHPVFNKTVPELLDELIKEKSLR